MTTILIVEDEENIRKLLTRLLVQQHYDVLTAENGLMALEVLASHSVDLLVLDVMMPKLDGFEVLQEVRQWDGELPIILVTAKAAVADKKKGFLAGADDYLVKPIESEEFILRVQALLRRAKIFTERKIILKETVLDREAFTVTTGEESVILPKKEFLLLFKLLSHPNTIFTRQQLMEDLWEREYETDERTIDTHIRRLRKRFNENADFTITTIRGLGYKAVKHETS